MSFIRCLNNPEAIGLRFESARGYQKDKQIGGRMNLTEIKEQKILEAEKWPTGEPFTDADKRALTYIVKNLYREQRKNDTTPSTAS